MPQSIGESPEQASKVYNCPVEASLDVLGGKWKVIILWYVGERPRRFGALKRLIPNISEKVLTEQLRELERDGLVRRTVYAQVPPKVEYSLTNYGETVTPIIDRLCAWGEEHCRRSNAYAEWIENR